MNHSFSKFPGIAPKLAWTLRLIIGSAIGTTLGLILTVPYAPQFRAVAAAPAFLCNPIPEPTIAERLNPSVKPEKGARLWETSAAITNKQIAFQRSKTPLASAQLIDAARERKGEFMAAMRNDPETALSAILDQQAHAAISGIAGNCVETPVTVTGSLEVVVADNLLDGTDVEEYVLISDSGERLTLRPAHDLKDPLESRTRVKIRGFRLDNEVLFDGSASTIQPKIQGSGVDVLSQPGNPPVVGEQRTAILLVNFRNTTQPAVTKAQMESFADSQLEPFYAENSYNKIAVNADVFGWYTLPTDQHCDFTTQSIRDLADADIDYTIYGRIIILAPFGPDCGWDGASTRGKWNLTAADGAYQASLSGVKYMHLGLVAHELGHAFGLGHAMMQDCGSASIAETGCMTYGYGDIFSVMGNTGYRMHLNSPLKEYLGWLEGSDIQTVTVSGRYTIQPMMGTTTTGGVPRALRVQRASGGSNDYAYLEYRQPVGFDLVTSLQTSTDVYLGALLHSSFANRFDSTIFDPTPDGNMNGMLSTATIRPGTPFVDPGTGARYSVVSVSPTALVVDVTLGRTDFTGPVTVMISPTNGSVVSGTITLSATATDTDGIAKVEFYKQGLFAPLGVVTTAPYSLSLDTRYVSNGNTTIWARAYDLSGQPSGTIGNFTDSAAIAVNIANIDGISPTVTMTSPANGATISGSFTWSAEASDNVGIQRLDFYRDANVYVASRLSSPYSFSMEPLTTGTHTLFVRAFDWVGNEGLSSVHTITVGPDLTPPIVNLTAPTNGATISGIVTVSAEASDNTGVSMVQFYIDNAVVPFLTDTIAPYNVPFTSTGVTDGFHTLRARAVDFSNNFAYSPSVAVVVDNAGMTVSLTSPADGASVSGLVALSASVSSGSQIQRVEFYRDTNVIIAADTATPYSVNWDTTSTTTGAHTLHARAYDFEGNVSMSPSRTVAVTSSEPGLDAATVGLWHFDSAAALYADSSGTGNTLTPSGNPVLVPGKFGSALNFDSSGDYGFKTEQSSTHSLDIRGPLTIDAWVNKTKYSGTDTIVQKWTSGYNRQYMLRVGVNGALRFDIRGISGSSIKSPAGAIIPGRWHHVAAVYDGSKIYLFIDGKSVAAPVAYVGGVSGGNAPFRISDSGAGSFNGLMDEVRISNVARWTANFTPPTASY